MIKEEDIKVGMKFQVKTPGVYNDFEIFPDWFKVTGFDAFNGRKYIKTDRGISFPVESFTVKKFCEKNCFVVVCGLDITDDKEELEKIKQTYNQEGVDSNESLHECLEKFKEEGKKMFESFSFNEITNKMLDTYIKKNHDYGNAFSEMYDELGINYGYGKIREKVNRIKTLKDGDAMVENEPLEDALLDCANYCILTLMEYQKHKKDGKDK